MSDNEATASAPDGWAAVVTVNVMAWLVVFLWQYFVPEQIGSAADYATILSGAIGGALAPTNSLKKAGLAAIAGIVSTILSLRLFVSLTGFRMGIAIGGIGTSFDAILPSTVFYTLIFLAIFAVTSTASWLGWKQND